MADTTPPKRKKTPKCPVCGRPRDKSYRPFCSQRCRDRDLSKWLDGAYAIPVVEEEEDREGQQRKGFDPFD